MCSIVSKVPLHRLQGKFLFLFIGCLYASKCFLLFVTIKKADKPCYDSLNGPYRVPLFWVIVRHCHADPFHRLESSIRSYHHYAWRLKRIFLRKNQLSMINPSLKRAVLQAKHTVVPFVYVQRVGYRNIIRQSPLCCFQYLLVLLLQPLGTFTLHYLF